MKKFFLFLILTGLFLLIIIWFFIQKSPNQNTSSQKKGQPYSPTPIQSTPTKAYELSSKDDETKAQWIVIRDPKKISLHSNLDEKLTSREAIAKHGCANLVSGGFYDQSGSHIGLFVSEGTTLNKYTPNQLFNAFFSLSYYNIPVISTSVPQNARLAIQSGPLLLSNGQPERLSLANDEGARRIVAALNADGNIVFIVLYNASSVILGPKLTDLPEIIDQLQKESRLNIKDAINLDGGSHSAFISDVVSLSEISPIGSYFCIKP